MHILYSAPGVVMDALSYSATGVGNTLSAFGVYQLTAVVGVSSQQLHMEMLEAGNCDGVRGLGIAGN
jgi:hypothetical protein